MAKLFLGVALLVALGGTGCERSGSATWGDGTGKYDLVDLVSSSYPIARIDRVSGEVCVYYLTGEAGAEHRLVRYCAQ
jgi:hypothetical protein